MPSSVSGPLGTARKSTPPGRSDSMMTTNDTNWTIGWRAQIGRGLVRLGQAMAPGPTKAGAPVPQPSPAPTAPVPLPEPGEPAAGVQISQLFYAALEAQTPSNLIDFIEFCNRFRRHSIFNARLIQTQRRGARACATAAEWRQAGRYVLPDARPIIILWPFGPTAHVYDVEDTGPVQDRAALGDPFAATTTIPQRELAASITRLVNSCAAGKQFHIEIVGDRLGYSQAGTAAEQGMLPVALAEADAVAAHKKVRAEQSKPRRANDVVGKKERWISSWRVKINDRMTPAEQLVTIAHELGHVFCGHLGGCDGLKDQGGWPESRGLGYHEREMEAEAVAWLVAKRAGVLSASAAYLERHVKEGQPARVDKELVARAAARIESLARLRYARPDRTRCF
jgi:hypothetical protein